MTKQYIAIGKTDLFYNSMGLCGNFTLSYLKTGMDNCKLHLKNIFFTKCQGTSSTLESICIKKWGREVGVKRAFCYQKAPTPPTCAPFLTVPPLVARATTEASPFKVGNTFVLETLFLRSFSCSSFSAL